MREMGPKRDRGRPGRRPALTAAMGDRPHMERENGPLRGRLRRIWVRAMGTPSPRL
jgi:hypothetical protein